MNGESSLTMNNHNSSNTGTLRPIQNGNNKYLSNLKTWLCVHCNFANDSLKIVCMNCRSSKQHQYQVSSISSTNEQLISSNAGNTQTYHSIQTKRKHEMMTTRPAASITATNGAVAAKSNGQCLNRSNEENECDGANGSEEKSSKIAKLGINQYCTSCSGCKNTSSQQPLTTTNYVNGYNLSTPQRPSEKVGLFFVA